MHRAEYRDCGQSNINIQDVRDFRSMFGLPANDPKIIVNGPDPGLQLASGDEEESDLDVEWAGAVAPAANIVFVTVAIDTIKSDAGRRWRRPIGAVHY